MTRNDILDSCLSALRALGEEDMALAIEALKERTSVSDTRVDERTDSPLPVTTAATVAPDSTAGAREGHH
jgi:hypothetical protein